MSTLAAAFAVARKELGEGFRDRQTLLYTFVLPVCMYPALFWVMVQGFLLVEGQKNAKDVEVGLVAPASVAEEATAAIAADPENGGSVEVRAVDVGTDDDEVRALVDPKARGGLHAVLVLPAERSDEEPATLYYDSTNGRSEVARDRVENSLRRWSNELREAAAEARSIDPDVLDPFEIRDTNVAEKESQGARALSLLLPMLLVVMCVLGAFFPAVDLTAGEKERRTAETTMLLPVPRLGLHLGKIFAVCASSMIATTLNLLAIGLSAGHLLQQIAGADGVVVELPVGALLAVAPLAVLFAFTVSAALTGIAGLASSFKEGQALLGPVQMVFIFPAIAASLPGLELDASTAWIPVVNVGLAFRAMLLGDFALVPLALCVVALVATAALAIWVSVRLLANEQVALSGETLSLGRALRLLRAPRADR
ncbi:MAG: ABC transporter permease [Planctomycetota bacterium]